MNSSTRSATATRRYRVVQWATGNVGSRALRRAIEHPDLDLVGVWVHSAAKVGRDAGELAGLEPNGIKATNSMEDVLAFKPDCVLYMPHVCNFDEICQILESGANIVTTRMELQNPAALDSSLCARIEAACQRGNSSIHATGSSPGFITEAMPIVLASIQRRLDSLSINEFADCSSRNSPEMLFGMMGFGRKPGPANQAQLDHARVSFAPSFQLVATALRLPRRQGRGTRRSRPRTQGCTHSRGHRSSRNCRRDEDDRILQAGWKAADVLYFDVVRVQ
jgi:2,4-diaminopentanoate dehydrogenase